MNKAMIKKLIEAWFYTEEVECTIVGATDINMLLENDAELEKIGGFETWIDEYSLKEKFEKWLEEYHLTDKYRA